MYKVWYFLVPNNAEKDFVDLSDIYFANVYILLIIYMLSLLHHYHTKVYQIVGYLKTIRY